MIRSSRSNRTAVAVDEVFSVFFLKAGRAAQFLENAECSINSLLSRFATQLVEMSARDLSASGAHAGAQISRLNLTREYRHQKRDQSPVGFRKKLFGFRAESICGVGFSKARLHARMDYEPVALQAGKMRAHGVISQAQSLSQIVHRAFSCPQKLKDFPSRTFEQPLPPAYMFH